MKMINFDNAVNARNTLNKEVKRLYLKIVEGFEEGDHLNEFGFLRDTYVEGFDRLLILSEQMGRLNQTIDDLQRQAGTFSELAHSLAETMRVDLKYWRIRKK